MKCTKTWTGITDHFGEIRRPDQPCPHELMILRTGVGSCPMHGLVYFETYKRDSEHKRKRRWGFRRG